MNGAVILWDQDEAPVPGGRDPIATLDLMEEAIRNLGFSLLAYPCRPISAISGYFWIPDTTTLRLEADQRVYPLNCYNPAILAPYRKLPGFQWFMSTILPKKYNIGLLVFVGGEITRIHLDMLRNQGYQVCLWYPEVSRDRARMAMSANYSSTWETIVGRPVQDPGVPPPVQEQEQVEEPDVQAQRREADDFQEKCIIS